MIELPLREPICKGVPFKVSPVTRFKLMPEIVHVPSEQTKPDGPGSGSGKGEIGVAAALDADAMDAPPGLDAVTENV